MNTSPRHLGAILGAALLLAGCHDSSTGPRDVVPPAAPRGLYSITGDHEVHLRWLANTEHDVAGYKVYVAPCARGEGCPYDRVGTTSGTQLVVPSLSNGVTRYFAVSAVDFAGNESPLTVEDIFDTPRPEGFGLPLDNYLETPATSAYDFSAGVVRSFDSPSADIYFGSNNNLSMMFAPFQDTEIQDAGYASTLDAVDYAPSAGWSPTGAVELIVGHCYVVLTGDNHYAKLRVTGLSSHRVVVDWAYQVDPGNRELGARRQREDGLRIRRTIRWKA